MISPPSRSRDLIFDAVAFKFTMVGRGTNASEQGAIKFLLVAFKAHRSVSLPTRVGWAMQYSRRAWDRGSASGAGSRSRSPGRGDRDGGEIMIPLPYQWDRDGSWVMISLPSRSRDLIFDAVDFKFTMGGRGTQAREQRGR